MAQFSFLRITMVCFQNGPFYAELQNKDYYKSINPFKVFNTQSQHFSSNYFQMGFQAATSLLML